MPQQSYQTGVVAVPYFQRKPYLQTVAAATGLAPPVQTPKSAEPTILDLATSVLTQETSNSVASDGPFRARHPVKAGQSSSLTLTLACDVGGDFMTIDFKPFDMRGPEGGHIPQTCVTVSPGRVKLGPVSSCDVTIEIAVPEGSSAGIYTGELDGHGSERLKIDIEIEVTG